MNKSLFAVLYFTFLVFSAEQLSLPLCRKLPSKIELRVQQKKSFVNRRTSIYKRSTRSSHFDLSTHVLPSNHPFAQAHQQIAKRMADPEFIERAYLELYEACVKDLFEDGNTKLVQKFKNLGQVPKEVVLKRLKARYDRLGFEKEAAQLTTNVSNQTIQAHFRDGKPIVDLHFKDNQHGMYVHFIDIYLLDKALEGSEVSTIDFYRSFGGVFEGVDPPPSKEEWFNQSFVKLFDSNNDDLSQPENRNNILRNLFDLK